MRASVVLPVRENRNGRLFQEFLRQIARHRLYLLFMVTFVAIEFSVLSWKGIALGSALDRTLAFVSFWIMAIVALAPMLFFKVTVFDRSKSPLFDYWSSFKHFFRGTNGFLSGFVMVLAIQPFTYAFSQLKAAITWIKPFSWDETFAQWDRVLHFGYQPWELLQPLLGYGPVSMLINVNYHFWFLTLAMYWLYFAFAETSEFERKRAIIAYMLTWSVGGVLLAVFFSSAGPCYYSKVVLGENPYAGLMGYLHRTNEVWPLWALDIQDTLWTNLQQNYGAALTKGISAMPSMHNAQALLLVLATWNKHRIISVLAILHGLLVFVGSIHLGWHYAIDGYLAFLIAGLAWLAAGWISSATTAKIAHTPAMGRS